MEQEQTKAYYAIIPANVRYDKDLPANAKLLYGEITALTNDKGYCWATNEYFANLYGVSKISVSNWISLLVKKRYLNSEMIYREGSKEIINRYLKIFYDPIKENFNTPIKENFKDNNTIINNTINNTYERESISKKFIKPNLEEVMSYCLERQNTINAQNFIDFYESKGWKVGNTRMKDWKACIRTWENKEKQFNQYNCKKPQANIKTRENINTSNLYDDIDNVEI